MLYDSIKEFISGWRFPVVIITMILGTVALMAAVLLIPPSAGSAYAFAEDFKTLCFGYDRSTGDMEWAYVWMFLVQPLILASLIGLVWRAPLVFAWDQVRGAAMRTSAGTLMAVSVLALTVPGLVSAGPVADPTEFPGSRIRTAVPAATFSLINQESQPIDLAALKGDVVIVTAVFATCGDTCPLILTQLKSAAAKLSDAERGDLHVIAITLDPETDTPAMLAMMAKQHGVEAPLFNTVTGDPDYVNEVLDHYDFRRWRNDAGVIEHTNLINVIDRSGHVAYRFTLGDLQQAWLIEALREVIAERPTT